MGKAQLMTAPHTPAPHTPHQIVIAITDEGGHVAWCTGSNPLGRSWVDGVVADWFSIHTPDGGEPHPSPAVA